MNEAVTDVSSLTVGNIHREIVSQDTPVDRYVVRCGDCGNEDAITSIKLYNATALTCPECGTTTAFGELNVRRWGDVASFPYRGDSA